jgi:hypothetical protein
MSALLEPANGVRPIGRSVVNALSIDVEEYYHATIFQEAVNGATAGLESRVESSTQRVLDLLEAQRVKATFFVLGEVGSAHPSVVRRIARGGHEVACHGYHHDLVFGQSPETFRAGIRRAKAVLEDLAGQPVVGYRAPSFSIGASERWAYEIWRSGPDRLVEFPIGTVRLFGVNLPVGGGGYFRLLPGGLFQAGIRRVNAIERRPLMFYFHPWELDPGQPRPAMPWHRRFRHYVGQERHEAKLARLIQRTRFGTARDVLGLVTPSAV